jgi:predicted acylesterase/phospholipase RssA
MAKKIINPQISGTTTIIQGTQIVSGNEGIDRQLQEAMSRIPERNKWVDGAFEGGVSYSPAYVGSLQVLEQSGIWFKRVAGTSAGGIIAGLIAVGYSASEIRWLTSNFPHRQVRPSSLPPNVAPLNLLEFLDLPVPNTISREMLQKTPEWEMIRGNAFEAFLDENLNIPTRSNLVNLVIQVINESNVFNTLITTGPNLTKLRKGLNVKAFPTFPNKVAKVRDFLQRSSDHDRREFAFKVCAELARTNPYYVLAIHLRQGREIFNGRRFLELYGPLLIAKRDRKSTRLNSSHVSFGCTSRMPSSA